MAIQTKPTISVYDEEADFCIATFKAIAGTACFRVWGWDTDNGGKYLSLPAEEAYALGRFLVDHFPEGAPAKKSKVKGGGND